MRIRSPLLISWSGVLFCAAMRILFRTLRLEMHASSNSNPYEDSDNKRFFYSVWHDSMVIPTFGGKHIHSAALISRHRDGSFVASVLKAVGMSAVRGSTNNGGRNALRQMMNVAKERHIVITPDGPRGPRRKMTSGIVFMASNTGNAIVPTAFACAKSWVIPGSWTDLMIPKPFTTVFLLAGNPVEIPADLSRDDLADYTSRIQTEMDRLNVRAHELAKHSLIKQPHAVKVPEVT